MSGPISHPLNRAKIRVSELKYIAFTLYSFYKNYFQSCSSAISTTPASSGARIAVFSIDVRLRVPPRIQEYIGEITEV